MKNQQQLFAEIERRLRELNLQVTEFCNIMGCSRSSYYLWRDGDVEISLDMAVKLSNYLGLSDEEKDSGLLYRPECARMIREQYDRGLSTKDIAVSFMTSKKNIVKILQSDDSYKMRLK